MASRIPDQQRHAHERNPKRYWEDAGPFDLIGDVHGCGDELEALLERLGYRVQECLRGRGLAVGPVYGHPEGRKVVFLGDLVDRGPRILDVLRLAHNMVAAGSAYCVAGNHDDKLMRLLLGRNVQIKHGLEQTVAELAEIPREDREMFRTQLLQFLEKRPHHYVLDQGRLVAAHAGLKEHMHGGMGEKVHSFALYGAQTGRYDEYGLPIRGNWAAHYSGEALVAYGHTPVLEPLWENRTVNLDTGCVYGGKLSALRYPELEIVSVPAQRVYRESSRPFLLTELNEENPEESPLEVSH